MAMVVKDAVVDGDHSLGSAVHHNPDESFMHN